MLKKFFTAFLFCVLFLYDNALADVAITDTYFPDENFRLYIIQNFNTDSDNTILSDSEIQNITSLPKVFTYSSDDRGFITCTSTAPLDNITDLKGIEFFTSLKRLYCTLPNLESIDLSHNLSLDILHIEGTKIQELDLSKNTSLHYLNCSNNNLASIDINGDTNLVSINCSGNNLTSLDLGTNISLDALNFSSNKITIINLTNNREIKYLLCSNNQLESLNVNRQGSLLYLDCSGNVSMDTLDVSRNYELKYLDCHNNNISSLNLEYNDELRILLCSSNNLRHLDLTNNRRLQRLDCSKNNLSELNISDRHTSLSSANTKCDGQAVSSQTLLKNTNGIGYQFDFASLVSSSADFANITDPKMVYSGDASYNFDTSRTANSYILRFTQEIPSAVTYSYTTGRGTMDVTVETPYSVPVISASVFPDGTGGQSYTASLTASGTTPISWDASGLPSGVSIDFSADIGTATISGTPSVGGSYDVTVTAKSSWGEDSLRFRLNIAVPENSITINEANFPDGNFRDYVKANFDLNSDDILTQSEIDSITIFPVDFSFDVNTDRSTGITLTIPSSPRITNFKGIEHFTNLTTLCLRQESSYVTSIDLSRNTALEALFVNNTRLRRLDVSNNTKLKYLECSDCGLTSLDVSKNVELIYLSCRSNDITSLNVTQNTKLERLYYPSNRIRTIDLSKNTALLHLWCSSNDISSLDVSRNTALEYLLCGENHMPTLNLAQNTRITWLEASPQTLSARTLNDSGIRAYPYVFSFSEVMSEDRFPGITALTVPNITVSYDKGIARFSAKPDTITYTYSTGASGTMSVTVPMNYVQTMFAPTITTRTLARGNEESEYSATLSATGTTPITWALIDGALPDGLTLSSAGAITGTPTKKGEYSFTVSAENVIGDTSGDIKLTINDPLPTPPTITTSTLRSGARNQRYRAILSADGTQPITWTIIDGELPEGVTLNEDTGEITGIPRETGTFAFTVEASNAADTTNEATLALVIRNAPSSNPSGSAPLIITSSLPVGLAGANYSVSLTASGTTPITWNIVRGNLPSGLTLSSLGEISGIPIESGTFAFTLDAENSEGATTKSFTLTIGSSGTSILPQISTGITPSDGTVGSYYTFTLQAAGARTITWEKINGILPYGLTMAQDGTISGTPTTAGRFVFTVEAENTYGTDSAELAINIYSSGSYEPNNPDAGVIMPNNELITYQEERDINSLTIAELTQISNDVIIAILPRFIVVAAGTYRFLINVDDTIQSGLPITWYPFSGSGKNGEEASFLGSHNYAITAIPEDRIMVVSVYLEPDTYAPVVTASRSGDDGFIPNDDNTSNGMDDGGGGGCNSFAGVIMIALLLFKKR